MIWTQALFSEPNQANECRELLLCKRLCLLLHDRDRERKPSPCQPYPSTFAVELNRQVNYKLIL